MENITKFEKVSISQYSKDLEKNNLKELNSYEDIKLPKRATKGSAGYDIHSTPGVEYVTVDPVYLRDNSEPPKQTAGDDPAEFFWLNGGKI